MKRFVFILCAIFICTFAFAQTIRWHVGDSIIRTDTCSSGDSVTPPTAPAGKTGYHFAEWVPYQPIEYLESTGTQYIDTGYKPNSNTRIEMDLMISKATSGIDDGTTSFEMGSRIATKNKLFCSMFYTDNRFRFLYGSNDFSDRNLSIDEKHSIIMYGTGRCYIDGVLQYNYNQENIDNNFNIYVFKFNNGGIPAGGGRGTLYYLKIYDNDILVRDLVPVLDTNGVACMFDKVTKQFFYNAGTGDFIAGPAVGE